MVKLWPFNFSKTGKLMEAVKKLGFLDSFIFATSIPVDDVNKWVEEKGVKDLELLIDYIGTKNLVKLYTIIGINKCLRLSYTITAEEMILLLRTAGKLSLPRLSRRQKDEMKKWAETAKQKRKTAAKKKAVAEAKPPAKRKARPAGKRKARPAAKRRTKPAGRRPAGKKRRRSG